MSNTRRARWTQAQVTAANAEALLDEMWTAAEADAALDVVGGRFLADLERHGHGPEVIAGFRERLAALGTEFWAGIAQQMAAK